MTIMVSSWFRRPLAAGAPTRGGGDGKGFTAARRGRSAPRVGPLTDRPVIVYSQVGIRGHTAARQPARLGHRVGNLDGGYLTRRAARAAR